MKIRNIAPMIWVKSLWPAHLTGIGLPVQATTLQATDCFLT